MTDYRPAARWNGGHLMTLYAWARPRRFPRLPPPAPRVFDVASNARVLAHCYWQPRRRHRPTVIALHGLEGSSSAHYMLGLADKAWARGWNAVLVNQRNCGGTEHLAETLYHSGLTNDPLAILRELIDVDQLPSLAIIGYSLGGNLTLKLAGELSAAAPPQLRACCAVSPTMDLAACVDALERPANRLYEWNFVRNLKARLRRKAACFPGRYDLRGLGAVRTVRQFDDAYTAPHFGFGNATTYYSRASARRVAAGIRVPTLIVTAADDPFVPPEQFDVPDAAGNPAIRRLITANGGHCGFIAESPNGYDGYWAEQTALDFVGERVNGL
jgi:predicted alpha/beta-fold hydrolase